MLERLIVLGLHDNDVVEVEGEDGGVEANEGEGLLVPAVVRVAGGIGNGTGA